LDISFNCWFRHIRVHINEIVKDQETMDQHFINQEVDGVEDKGSGNTTVDVKTLVDAFLNMHLRSQIICNH
jgi:hypothetical protein